MIDEQVLLRRYMQATNDSTTDAAASAHHALMVAIEEEVPRQALKERRLQSRRRPLRLSNIMIAAGIVIVAVAIGVPLLTPSGGPVRSGPTALPKFRLTGDIEQAAWAVKGNLGSQSYQLVCPTPEECFVTEPSHPSNAQTPPDGIVEASHDGGQTWGVSLDVPSGDLVGLTCPTASTCVVTGEDLASGNPTVSTYVTTNGGVTWSSAASPGVSLESGLMSCSSIPHCVTTTSAAGPQGKGIESFAQVTEDGGKSWGTYPFPGPFRPSQLQCIGQQCVALGEAPPGYLIQGPTMLHGIAAAAYSSDGGKSWSMGTVPSADETNGLSCADSTHCFGIEATVTAAGSSKLGPVSEIVIESDDGGASWMPTIGNDASRWLLDSLSCPTAEECWITGSIHSPGQTTSQAYANYESPDAPATFVKVTEDGGNTWTSVQIPTVGGIPIKRVGSITCVDATSCFAIAQDPTSPTGSSQRQLVIATPSSQKLGVVGSS